MTSPPRTDHQALSIEPASTRAPAGDVYRGFPTPITGPVGVPFVPDEAMVRLIRERDNLFLLHEALAAVEGASTLKERLTIFVEAIQKIGFGRVTITLRDTELNPREVVSAGLDSEEDHELRRVSTPGRVWCQRLETLRTIAHLRVSNSYYLDARDPWVEEEFHDALPSRLESEGRSGWSPRDALLVPLRGASGEVVATLVLDDPSDRARPTLSRVRTVELFAQQVASIIERARLLEESQRERHRAEALADVARAVSGSLRLDDVMQLILRHAVALLHVEGATLSLLRGTHGDEHLAVVAACGTANCLLGMRLPIIGSLSGKALRSGMCIVSNDVTQATDVFQPNGIDANVQKTLLVPLTCGDGPVGVLGVSNRDLDFTDDDAVVLQRLADQVAVAVANARLFEEHRTVLERYTRLVESAADAIVTMDERGRLTSVNQALERATGRLRSSLLGLPLAALFDARDEAAAIELLSKTLAGQQCRAEVRYIAIDREMRSGSITATPIVEAGRVSGALAIMRDVTDEKRLTEQLMQQEKLAAVGQLVSGVAHELNNPLAGVMAFSQLLLSAHGKTPASPAGSHEQLEERLEERRAIETIHEEAKRAAKIVSNLLTFARQHQPERTLTDLNQIVEDTLELRRYALRVRQIDLDVRLDDQMPITWADPFQLQQVVLNLVANAEHALEEWVGERRITISTSTVCRVGKARGEVLVLRIADTGPGIAAEHLPRIFNPFFTTKPVGEGTGLGLSISDGIVREHGGRIRAESVPGQGAAFVIELPFVPPPGSVETNETGAPAAPTVPRHILVVDDEPAIRGAVTAYLRSLGHAVDTVASGREALSLVAQRKYDAVLLDLRMPGMSGDHFYGELIRRAPLVAERVVFLTGDTQSESARGFLESTGRPTISKPFLLDELAAVLLAV